MNNKATTSTEGRDLILTRIINAPREKVFEAWTNPELLKQWFAPSPWTTPVARVYECLHKSLGAFGKALHDGDPHLRGQRR
jgi:hypothetical protein